MAVNLANTIKELRPHFIFKAIEVGGGAAMVWLVQELHRNPGYVIGTVSFVAGTLFTGIVLGLVAHKGQGWFAKPQGMGSAGPQLPFPQVPPDGPIRVLRDNKEMERELNELLDRHAANVRNAILIQYSGQKAIDCVNLLRDRTSADIDLYLVDPARALSPHQKKRIQTTLETLRGVEIRRHVMGSGVLHVYTYQAPGSVRAILVEGIAAYVSSYFYRVDDVGPGGSLILDSRGHDQPLFVVPAANPGFPLIENAIKEMVKSWKENNLRTEKLVIDKSDS